MINKIYKQIGYCYMQCMQLFYVYGLLGIMTTYNWDREIMTNQLLKYESWITYTIIKKLIKQDYILYSKSYELQLLLKLKNFEFKGRKDWSLLQQVDIVISKNQALQI